MVAAPSLSRNVAANALSQGYVVLAGVVMMPVYLHYMGQEAYGLVGFFTLMTVGFQLIDLSLSPTVARECARFRAGVLDARSLTAAFRTFGIAFAAIAGLASALGVWAAEPITLRWLNVETLPADAVTRCVVLMALTAPLLALSGFFRGVLNGYERQATLAGLTIMTATIRFGGVLAVLALVGGDPRNFFWYQLAAAGLELAVLAAAGWRLLPRSTAFALLTGAQAKALAAFSGGIAFAALIGLAITQTDRLVLSGVLGLSAYGVFSLTVAVAGGVSGVSMPLAQALLPRLSRVVAQGGQEEAARLYGAATQAGGLIAAPIAAVMAFLPQTLLWALTGNAEVSSAGSPILPPYALGNLVSAMAAFSYYLQYAHGRLRLHVIGHAVLAAVLVPALAFAAFRYGPIAAGYVWLAANLCYLLFWTPVVHRAFGAGLNRRWLTVDAAPIVISALIAAFALSRVLPQPESRVGSAMILALAWLGAAFAAGLASSAARERLRLLFRRSPAPAEP